MRSIKTWNYLHSFALLAAGGMSLWAGSSLPLLLAALLSFLLYLMWHSSYLARLKPFAGYANWVTTIRLILIFILGHNFATWSSEQIAVLAFLCILMDGLDGMLARKFDQSSDFGAYLDMEVDAFFVALFCLNYYLDTTLDWWILLPGFMRYLYVVFILVFQLQHRKEKSTPFAKTIAVLLFLALLLPLILPAKIYQPIVFCAAILTLYSFGVSFISILNTDNQPIN